MPMALVYTWKEKTLKRRDGYLAYFGVGSILADDHVFPLDGLDAAKNFYFACIPLGTCV